jgi:hypothetical protein
MGLNDTRLWRIKDDIEDLLQQVRSFTSGPAAKDPVDGAAMRTLLKLVSSAHEVTTELMDRETMPLCRRVSAVGSTCYRQAEHEGGHRSQWGSTWTNESDRATGDAIAKSMEGKRD